MTYSAGNTILDDDYNGFKDSINTMWSTGSGSAGYGQTAVAAVAAGSTITATQWATLLSRISSAASHQGTSITSITNPSAGATISAYAALAGNITSVTGTNRLNAAANGGDSSANTTTTAGWAASASTTKTITFASANAKRWFFNAGGMIRMSWARSGGTASAQNTSWTNLLGAAGTIVVTGAASSKTIAGVAYTGTSKKGGSGSPTTLATTTGADVIGGAVTIFKQLGAQYLYTTNYINVNASGSSTNISFAVTLIDNDAPAGPDSVNGTLTMTTTIRPPSTTYVSAAWGSVTQNSAAWSVS
tara:strand:- start:348 stop:1256 length:909 start_codon:yes stop_codon:yes gene_type:complete